MTKNKSNRNLSIELWNDHYSTKQIAEVLGISQRTVQKYLQDNKEINDLTFKSIAKAQKETEAHNKSKKIIKEAAKSFNALENLNVELKNILESKSFSPLVQISQITKSDKVGIIQLSDIHFNEIIDDVYGNVFNFEVASARLKKFVDKAKYYFRSQGINSVAIFMTGDLMNSDRRLDEVTSNATNRANALFIAVDILQQLIMDLLSYFTKITISSITGNESRITQDVNWSSLLSGDSYDIIIHNMLTVLFKDFSNVDFITVSNPMEQVVKVCNSNFLLVHGHGHGRLAFNQNIEGQIQNLKANYASKGIKIDYVICGHLHQSFISDCFSRSSGLPGVNSYSTNALNLNGKSSQNLYVVSPDGSIDGIKVCLQEYDLKNMYNFDKTMLKSTNELFSTIHEVK